MKGAGEIHVEGGPPQVTVDEIRRRVRAHQERTGVDRAILFGSFARGDADAASDIDLLLIEPTTAPFVERALSHLPLLRMGPGLDLLVYTPEEYERLRSEGNPLIERVEREGVTVYARSED
jgi:predicted nucleotidyltransferase